MYLDFVAVEHTAHRTGEGAAESATKLPESISSVPADPLAGFVPELLARRIADRLEPVQGSTSDASELAVLGLDISESTSIIEDVVKWSPDGSERIADALNTVFTLLADVITEHGGLVLTLAGDEIVAVWPTAESGGPATSVLWAARAALVIQEKASHLEPVGGYPIRLRAGIGLGPAWLLDIGREQGRRIFVPVGPAIQEMTYAQRAVDASETGVSEAVRSLLGARARAEVAGGHPAISRLTAVDPVLDSPPPPAQPRPSAPSALVARYVPELVLDRIRSGLGGLQSEFAPITAMFIALRAARWDEDAAAVLTEATLQALDILNSYEGTLVSAGQDRDGLTLVAGFGLPPAVREREALRANLAALEISRVMQGFVEHGIGVATGHAFCGVCGSPALHQYTMVGPIVNLAARLMQRAQNEVLCDQVSQHLSQDRLRFSSRGRMEVKGFAGPVEVYRPVWHEVDPGLPTLRRLAGESNELMSRGRDREREELAGRLVALSLGTSTAVIVEGEPGVGKTHLAVDLLRASEGYGRITVLVGGGDDLDPRPYHAWKRVFARALGLTAVRDPAKRALLVKERLSKSSQHEQWAPLLNEILDLTLDDSALRDMTGRARRENTLRLLVDLLTDAASRTPLLVVLDDCQWMDSASWDLVRAVYRSVEPVMIVLLTRPMPEAPSPMGTENTGDAEPPPGPDEGAIYTASGVRSYLLGRGAKVLQLQPLPPDITEQIARDFLGVEALDEHVRSLFRSRVDGSPLFTIELAFQLRTDELISVVGTGERAQARLSVPPAELDRLRLPVRVEEVFRARLSRLSERQRTVIKAASVVGTSFDEKRVLAADPLLDPRLLPDDLNDLEQKKVIETGAEGWRFAHTLIRDLAQQSLLPSELRQRHRALAEWYEAREMQPEDYAIIARHWAAANEPARQIEYLEAAATSALAKGAEEEAASLVETAMAVDASLAQSLATVSDRRRAFWCHQLGQALADQNRLDDAIRQFGTALRLLGQRVPKTRLGWLAYLIWQTAIQVLHLLPVVGPRLVNRGDATVLSQAAWIASKLAQTYYFKAQAVQTVATHLAAINLAEKADDPGLAGVAFSGLGNLVGTMRLHRLASRYLQLAREKIVGEPSGTDSRLTLEVLPDLAWEHGLTATVSEAVYLRTMNRAMDVTPMLDDVVQQYRAFGQNQALEITLAVRGFFHHADGKLRSARADFEEQLISARRRGNAEHVIWGLTLLIPVLTSLDRTTEALALDSEAVQLFEEKDRLNRPNFYGSHVQALVAQGLTAEALSFARQSLKTLAGVPNWFHLGGLTAMTQACIGMLDGQRGTGLEKDAHEVCRRSLRALKAYLRVYPFSRGRYCLYFGMYRAVQGRNRAARRQWTRGLDFADLAGLQLDAARIRLLLAQQLPEGSPSRVKHQREARRTLDELGLHRLKEFEDLHL
jgi:class 3 adenylate cyclase/tetratricopeptide (TPR) repeat protein